MLGQTILHSSLCDLYLVASPTGLRAVYWQASEVPMVEELKNNEESKKIRTILAAAALQIIDYLAGKRQEFKLTLEPLGTDFQKTVWDMLLRIPYGKTKTYGEIAEELGIPGSSRAVGTAIKNNPLCIVIPCHRVVPAKGGLGGFSGGEEIKKKLLELEKP